MGGIAAVAAYLISLILGGLIGALGAFWIVLRLFRTNELTGS
jgi:hypothetical protein